jgi:hypothetical protein
MSNAREAIDRFVRSARRPALLEPGEPLLPFTPETFHYEEKHSHVLLQAWDETRNIVRRVTAVREQSKGKLSLTIRKFANREGELLLVDLAVPAKREWSRRGEKLLFRERFRQFLQRELTEWEVAGISAEADLEHSLSPTFPRALLRQGRRALAAIAAPPDEGDPSSILTFALIWLAHLRRREARLTFEGIVILLPKGQEHPTTLRIPYLSGIRIEVFTYCENDRAVRLDPSDYGNLDTTLEACHRSPHGPSQAPPELDGIEGFEQIGRPDGSASLRIHGLEFANLPTQLSPAELSTHARELSRLRRTPGSLLNQKDPERWLESQVRADIASIDASLRPGPIYGQVPAFTAGDRGVIDLLAAEHSGRLAVLELKASADIHLPIQALDYWMRVAIYAQTRAFSPAGYFPGVPLTDQFPRLILVAPSLEFHPSTETILSFFSPKIEVQRIGLAAQWRDHLRVMFRLNGHASPSDTLK